MKKYIIFLSSCLVAGAVGLSSCTKSDFADAYAQPSTLNQTTLEKQFAGVLTANLDYTMYRYSNYFVTLQNTCLPWTQAVGVINTNGRYVPGAAAISGRWQNYYTFLAQYKDFLNIYNNLPPEDQAAKKIYLIAATIFYDDMTQKQVDLHGDIPWSQAGLLSTNKGNYNASYAKYDPADSIYTTMLDQLKDYADQLSTMTIDPAVATVLKSQDFINNGDVTLWAKYCNSLRLRMLMRVSGVAALKSRVNQEIGAILTSPSKYPLILKNDDNALIRVYNLNSVTVGGNTISGINNGSSTGQESSFYTGLYGWGGGDVPSKAMIDLMNSSSDPRLRVMFQPGDSTNGKYIGLDPTQNQTLQQNTYNAAKVSRYNYSTLTYNLNIPGVLIDAAEVNFLLSEYYLNSGNAAQAKATYETGIRQSIDFYYNLRAISNDNTEGAVTAPTAQEINNYLADGEISWNAQATQKGKLNLIATQKWVNYSVLEPIESWAEQRRLKLPEFTFLPDNANTLQKLPPDRWTYPTNESSFNTANYEAVKAKDKLTTKIFWDVN